MVFGELQRFIANASSREILQVNEAVYRRYAVLLFGENKGVEKMDFSSEHHNFISLSNASRTEGYEFVPSEHGEHLDDLASKMSDRGYSTQREEIPETNILALYWRKP